MEFTLKTGAVLHVTPARFDDSNALKKALLAAAKGLELDLADLKSNGSQIDVGVLINPILEALTSELVEACIFKCAAGKALYENIKVDKALFDDANLGEQAREDYHEICLKIIEVNCTPLFKQTFSVFMGLVGTVTTTLKSQSTSATKI